MNDILKNTYKKLIDKLVIPELEVYHKLYLLPVVDDWSLVDIDKDYVKINMFMREGDMSPGSEEAEDFYPGISHLILNVGGYVFTSKFSLSITFYDVYGLRVFNNIFRSDGIRYSNSEIERAMKDIYEYHQGSDEGE